MQYKVLVEETVIRFRHIYVDSMDGVTLQELPYRNGEDVLGRVILEVDEIQSVATGKGLGFYETAPGRAGETEIVFNNVVVGRVNYHEDNVWINVLGVPINTGRVAPEGDTTRQSLKVIEDTLFVDGSQTMIVNQEPDGLTIIILEECGPSEPIFQTRISTSVLLDSFVK